MATKASSFRSISKSLQAAQLLDSNTARISFEGQLDTDKLVQLVEAALIFRASDPRDKIFGLLGLPFGRIQQKSLGRRESIWDMSALKEASILPDYSRSASVVYRNTAMSIMNATGSLLLLEMQDVSSASLRSLDSWVYDWNTVENHSPVCRVVQGYRAHYSLEKGSHWMNKFSKDSIMLPFEVLRLAPADALWPFPTLALKSTDYAWTVRACDRLASNQDCHSSPCACVQETDIDVPISRLGSRIRRLAQAMPNWKHGLFPVSPDPEAAPFPYPALFPPSIRQGDEVRCLSGSSFPAVLRNPPLDNDCSETNSRIYSYIGPVLVDYLFGPEDIDFRDLLASNWVMRQFLGDGLKLDRAVDVRLI
jgi:hypothetical protein